MVRLAGASTRNRNRQLSNKYRLKVIHGDVVGDFDIADEDREKSQYTNLVAGVDAEDANEHHLREVLHASSQHVYSQFSTRGAPSWGNKPAPQTPAFIPTPDSTGIVENYPDLYAPNRWKDPITYICTSISPEQSCTNALANDFTYYMDERDKEWLDRNNGAARGEGTSSQGAMSSATRISVRSSKAKGKDPEPSMALVISEDEFELVMGLFEKVTHEKTEYLHHGLENGMAFPAFSEYQDTFSSPLSPAMFASYSVPQWIPTPLHLVRTARIIYHYWKERRTERGGHRIIPILNFDESDVLNESYVCFRRREIKTVRKTRASQATSSDKLFRLQAELLYPLELGKQLLQREQLKRESVKRSQQVWDKRILLADFKRKYPGWGDKEDQDLLVDRNRPKRVELLRPPKTKLEVSTGASVRPEPIAMPPSERSALINAAVEKILTRHKEEDRHWEDKVDDPYQTPFVPYSNRCFKYAPLPLASPSDAPEKRVYRALRTRVGRGGRFLVDRQNSVTPSIVPTRRSLPLETAVEDDDQWLERMQERWRYDADDVPAVGPLGPEEINRVLVDDYSPRFLRHSVTFLLDPDQQSVINDPALPVINDGRQQLVVPFRLGLPPVRRLPPRSGVPQPPVAPIKPIATPMSVQQLKTMTSPLVPQTRISMNGGMRSNPLALSIPGPPRSPSNSATPVRQSPSNSGIHRAAINLPHTDPFSAEVVGRHSALNGGIPVPQTLQHDTDAQQDPQPQSMNVANSSRVTTTAQTSPVNSIQPGVQGIHGLTALQMQNLKLVFASAQAQTHQDVKGASQTLPPYLQANSANFALHQQLAASNSNLLKLPATRQIQRANDVPKSPISSGIDSQNPGRKSPSAVQAGPIPVSSPVSGMRPGIHVASNGQLSPSNQHNTPATLVYSSSPLVTPTPTMR